MSYEAALKDYTSFDFNDGRWTRKVYRRGTGPAVIIMHEMPGLHPLVIRFADRVAAAGMTVFMPVLFGEPGRPVSMGYGLREMLMGICIRREFHVWATDKSSPIIDWLRALAKKVHAECPMISPLSRRAAASAPHTRTSPMLRSPSSSRAFIPKRASTASSPPGPR